eukprot:756089-Hanusia_phi.AAC.3
MHKEAVRTFALAHVILQDGLSDPKRSYSNDRTQTLTLCFLRTCFIKLASLSNKDMQSAVKTGSTCRLKHNPSAIGIQQQVQIYIEAPPPAVLLPVQKFQDSFRLRLETLLRRILCSYHYIFKR